MKRLLLASLIVGLTSCKKEDPTPESLPRWNVKYVWKVNHLTSPARVAIAYQTQEMLSNNNGYYMVDRTDTVITGETVREVVMNAAAGTIVSSNGLIVDDTNPADTIVVQIWINGTLRQSNTAQFNYYGQCEVPLQ